jgi:hypothetical protein
MDLNKFEKWNMELGAQGMMGRKSRQIGFERAYSRGERSRIELALASARRELFNLLLFIK